MDYKERLDKTFGYVKSAWLTSKWKHPENQGDHIGWAHGQDTPVVKTTIKSMISEINNNVSKDFGLDQLAYIFGYLKNGRLISEDHSPENMNDHIGWARSHLASAVKNEIRLDEDRLSKALGVQ